MYNACVCLSACIYVKTINQGKYYTLTLKYQSFPDNLCFTSVVLLSLTQAYWRSCSALLGQVLVTAFKDDFAVELLDTPEVPGTGSPVRLMCSQSIVAVFIDFFFFFFSLL